MTHYSYFSNMSRLTMGRLDSLFNRLLDTYVLLANWSSWWSTYGIQNRETWWCKWGFHRQQFLGDFIVNTMAIFQEESPGDHVDDLVCFVPPWKSIRIISISDTGESFGGFHGRGIPIAGWFLYLKIPNNNWMMTRGTPLMETPESSPLNSEWFLRILSHWTKDVGKLSSVEPCVVLEV